MDPTIYIKLSNTLPQVQSRVARGDANIHTGREENTKEEQIQTKISNNKYFDKENKP